MVSPWVNGELPIFDVTLVLSSLPATALDFEVTLACGRLLGETVGEDVEVREGSVDSVPLAISAGSTAAVPGTTAAGC